MEAVTELEFYDCKSTEGNSGYDLYLPNDVVFPAGSVVKVDFGIAMKTVSGSGFWLLPRSSMAKTVLRLANSVGLIDPTYRGPLIGAFHNISDHDITITRGTRLVQVALPSLLPFKVKFRDSLDATERGEGGFGSTGGTYNDVNYIR